MSVAEKVKTVFSGLGASHTMTPLTFAEIDIQKNKKKMRLKEEGTLRGSNNLPRSEAVEFDDVEQSIISFINQEVHAAIEAVSDHLQSFQHRMQNMHGVGHSAEMEKIAIAAEGSFKANVLKRKAELFTTREEVTNIKTSFDNFRARNGLEGDASYPDSRFFYFSVVVLLVVLETYVNGMFFAQGHEQGMIGGILTALIPSILNAILGFCLGNYALRLFIHKYKPKKVAGVALSILLPLLMIGLNLSIAHLRTAMIGLSEGGTSVDAARIALQSVSTTPFALHDLESWLLFAMGCACCLIVTLDFWKMDDPYSGFGAISREYKEKINQYAEMKAAALEELEDIQKESHSELDEAKQEVSAMSSEAGTVFESQNRWRLLYSAHLTHLEDAAKQLLGYYRTANMTARKTEPPAHFNQTWKLKKVAPPEPDESFLSALKTIQSETKNVQEAYITCARRIGKAYDDALNEYQTIEQL
ncbi:MAG: hypothetical protein PW788_06055 [Micavibrio sp.]|nr:hypothetical protein [Micavibrio sp.]